MQNLFREPRFWIRAWWATASPAAWHALISASLMVVLLAPVDGCSRDGGGKIKPPQVDPAQAAASALENYDQDGDGTLTKHELEACPGILRSLATYDANHDGSVDAAELKSHFETLYSSEVGLLSAGCTITRSGEPVVGATVRFIPEAFLGEAVFAAEGITDRSGFAQIAVPDEKLPASHHGLNMAQVGVYRVEVETSPGERVATKSLLGIELNPTSRRSSNPTFDLDR